MYLNLSLFQMGWKVCNSYITCLWLRQYRPQSLGQRFLSNSYPNKPKNESVQAILHEEFRQIRGGQKVENGQEKLLHTKSCCKGESRCQKSNFEEQRGSFFFDSFKKVCSWNSKPKAEQVSPTYHLKYLKRHIINICMFSISRLYDK